MEPGDVVLHESHSVLYGQPYPMRGNYCSNVCTIAPWLHLLVNNAAHLFYVFAFADLCTFLSLYMKHEL